MDEKHLTYTDAGVDIDKGNNFVNIIKRIANNSSDKNVIGDIGGFGSLYSLKLGDVKDPVLVSSTDGVGTKLKIAFMMNKHNTVGIDLVAMVVNDISVQGAKPLFFLDYMATGKLDLGVAEEIIKGIVQGCNLAGCSLVGGETAEMPGFYKKNEYDLAGFSVGLVDKSKIINGSKISAGDILIGLSSSGLHSNGYSLVREIFFNYLQMDINTYIKEFGTSLGEELLKPTRIYSGIIESVLSENIEITGISHITGGGLIDNIDRLLPKNCKSILYKNSWRKQPIFEFIQSMGNVRENEMLRTFNNGIGLVFITPQYNVEKLMNKLFCIGEHCNIIGEIRERK